jgi:non-lysosomal glucosylceramidase
VTVGTPGEDEATARRDPAHMAPGGILDGESVAIAPAPVIPAVAWRRPLGLPCPEVGRSRVDVPMIDDGEWSGVPLGGMGAGSIGPTFRGDVARWHLDVGRHTFAPLPACGFSVYARSVTDDSSYPVVAQRLTTLRPDTLEGWGWDLPIGAGTYHALFPRAWTTFEPPALPVRLTIEQLSPVLPGDYRTSSLPVGTFSATIENPSDETVSVGLMLSWQNVLGAPPGETPEAGAWAEAVDAGGVRAVRFRGPSDTPTWRSGTLAIAASEAQGIQLSRRTRFDARADTELWADFARDGALEDDDDRTPSRPGQALGAAIAATMILGPGERRSVRFAVAWDLPLVEFGRGRRWRKRYTRWWGVSGERAVELAAEGLDGTPVWREAITAWQAPVIDDETLPAWYRAALFNELYFLVDGGTFWEDGEETAPPRQDGVGRFALLECIDYRFYNTVDVNATASIALLSLWPDLALRTVRDVATAIAVGLPETVTIQASGASAPRKLPGTVPHDLGGPEDDPYHRPNWYRFQDVNGWKDLGPKFVLEVWRDHIATGDQELLVETWPTVVDVLERIAAHDLDGDGLPEHDGSPDQTYDTWPMRGPSAYGGSLWLAALRAAEEIARTLGRTAEAGRYRARYEQARLSFDQRLWRDGYYAYDGGSGPSSDSIMADQLAGQGFADASGLGDLVSPGRIEAALRTVHRHNVGDFGDGLMGAVNGMRPDGTIDLTSEQSQEVWIGTTYALAGLMLDRGLDREAWETASGAARVTYERGLWFRTPEAYDRRGDFRASLYLRPLAIWAIEDARQRRAARLAG